MSKFSNRVSRINPSATLKIADMARSLKEEGKDIISLSVGEPDLDTPSHIKACAKNALDEGFIHYTNTKGITELKNKISEKFRYDNDIQANMDEIIVTPGSKFSIFLVCQSLIDTDDSSIILDPSWVTYSESIKMAEGKVVRCPTNEKIGINTERFKDIVERTEGIKLAIINSPCNPSGRVYKKEKLRSIAEICLDNDIYVLSDEVYEKIIYEGEHYSPGSEYSNVITVNGFSKAYSMTGWRVGYVTGPRDIINEMAKIQQHSVSCANSFAQKGAFCALNSDKSNQILKERLEKFKERRDILMEGFDSIEGIDYVKPEGTFYMFPNCGGESVKVAEKLLKEFHVAVTPGSAFGELGEGHLRVSFANSKERIREAISRMEGAFPMEM